MVVDRRLHYYTLLILSILIASSFYLSWTTDTGLGTIHVERRGIVSPSGKVVNFTLYLPRDPYPGFLPTIVTLHGVGGAKEAMYSFNIELARKNFIVISVDLAGHGDSTESFDYTNYTSMAEDCYWTWYIVESTLTLVEVHPSRYGVVGHSFGVHVGLAMYDMPVVPEAVVAVGPVWMEEVVSLPGNVLLAAGEYDELIPAGSLLETLRTVTGNPNAEVGTTYGDFSSGTAYRLVLTQTNHVFEATDATIVAESVAWMLQALHGDDEPYIPSIVDQLIYTRKSIAFIVGAVALILSVIPLLSIVLFHLPKQAKPPKIPSKTIPMAFRRDIAFGIGLGALFVSIYALTGVLGIALSSSGIQWPSSMLATGLILFFLLCPLIWSIIMPLIAGKQNSISALAGLGYARGNLTSILTSVGKAMIPAGVCVVWLLVWSALGGMPGATTPVSVLPLLRFPNEPRILNILIMTGLALPFAASDAMWTRSLKLPERYQGNRIPKAKGLAYAFGIRMLPTLTFALLLVLGSSFLGLISVPVVLLGLMLLHFVLASAFVSGLILVSSGENENPWPAIVISGFIYAWILIGIVPLV
jgi:pimeloyl-ACP methyl ester carboxylesterase